MKLGSAPRGGAFKNPEKARRLYEDLTRQIGALSVVQQLALVRCFQQGRRWQDLPEQIQAVFRAIADGDRDPS